MVNQTQLEGGGWEGFSTPEFGGLEKRTENITERDQNITNASSSGIKILMEALQMYLIAQVCNV